jgi:hypothetical protein
MAFDKTKLELLAGGGAVLSLWAYASATDTGAEIDATGYFNAAAAVLKPADWVLVNAADKRGIAVIASNAAGVVDTADLLAVGTADSR